MKNASDYLAHIKAVIALNTGVVHWTVVREEAQGNMGLLRYRLVLKDGSSLEMFGCFRIVAGQADMAKYSFHWQDSDGHLIRRWDNAAHHPEVPTHPHHVHDGVDTNVQPHGPVSAEEVLGIVMTEMSG